MLVLTRKIGEEIVINDDIRISVVRIRGKRVRLGVKAPTNVHIRRREFQSSSGEELPAAQLRECGR